MAILLKLIKLLQNLILSGMSQISKQQREGRKRIYITEVWFENFYISYSSMRLLKSVRSRMNNINIYITYRIIPYKWAPA